MSADRPHRAVAARQGPRRRRTGSGAVGVAELVTRVRGESQAGPHSTLRPTVPSTAPGSRPSASVPGHQYPTVRSRATGRLLAGAFTAATALAVVSSLDRPVTRDTDIANGTSAEPGAVLAAPGPNVVGPDGASREVVGAATGPEAGAGRPPALAVPRPTTPANCSRPGRILSLANWKLTLPTGSSEKPTEVTGSRLRSFVNADWFAAGPGCEAVAFRAPVDGVTTKGSKNPRSELREMADGGADEASWSSTAGTHTMVVKEAFTKLPEGKPHLVGAQIHDAEDDVSVFRLEGSNLWVTEGDNSHYALVTDSYVLGTPFEAKYVVTGGVVRAYYNGRLVTTIAKEFTGAYFKAGAYTQANCENAAPCDPANYGETLIYALKVTHT